MSQKAVLRAGLQRHFIRGTHVYFVCVEPFLAETGKLDKTQRC